MPKCAYNIRNMKVLRNIWLIVALLVIVAFGNSARGASAASTAVIVTDAVTFKRNLSVGMSGADVSAMQRFLITSGYLKIFAPTGYFGPSTQIALSAWQTSVAISPANGSFGPISRGTMNTASGGGTFSYAGWIPFWKQQNGANNMALNLEKVSEVSPFSYEVGAKGKLLDTLKINEGLWPAWLSAVHDAHIKIIPTIAWFYGDAIHSLLSKTSSRVAHEDAIAKLVQDQHFDGIDIDYESKLSETMPYFSLLLKGLAMRLHPKGKTLVCTIEARMPVSSLYDVVPDFIPRANDYVALNKYCDEVRVMAYDQGVIDRKLNARKGNGTIYAPVADPNWVEGILQEALKTIDRKKVVLAIPTYGYEYQISWANGYTIYERLRSHTYLQAMDRSKAVGVAAARNSAGELSFVYATSTFVDNVSAGLTWKVSSTMPAVLASMNTQSSVARYVSFSDAESAAQKIALARKFGLRGVVFFKFDGEADPLLWEKMK